MATWLGILTADSRGNHSGTWNCARAPRVPCQRPFIFCACNTWCQKLQRPRTSGASRLVVSDILSVCGCMKSFEARACHSCTSLLSRSSLHTGEDLWKWVEVILALSTIQFVVQSIGIFLCIWHRSWMSQRVALWFDWSLTSCLISAPPSHLPTIKKIMKTMTNRCEFSSECKENWRKTVYISNKTILLGANVHSKWRSVLGGETVVRGGVQGPERKGYRTPRIWRVWQV